MGTGAPVDWYRTSFAPNFEALYWEEGAEEKVALALEMLEPEGHERILDLACATGRRTLELCRRGFEVVGVDIREELLSPAGEDAMMNDLWPHFERTWLAEGQAIDLIEQQWNAPTRRIDGTRRTIVESDAPEYAETVPFQRRLYSVEELAEIFESVGLSLANVFDEDGAPCAPSDVQREIYVEARA